MPAVINSMQQMIVDSLMMATNERLTQIAVNLKQSTVKVFNRSNYLLFLFERCLLVLFSTRTTSGSPKVSLNMVHFRRGTIMSSASMWQPAHYLDPRDCNAVKIYWHVCSISSTLFRIPRQYSFYWED